MVDCYLLYNRDLMLRGLSRNFNVFPYEKLMGFSQGSLF
jgi:hypothetical protein